MLDRMFLGQFGQQAYWIGVLTGSTSAAGQAVAVDSSGNVFVCGRSTVSSNISIYLAKYNSSGVLQWQRKLGTSSNGYAVTVDSSGDVYVGGEDAGDMELAKYNTSGTIQWQVKLTPSVSGGFSLIYGLDTDSSNNVYICGAATIANSTTDSILTAKYNSSGTLQWQRRLYRSSDIAGSGVAVDGSGNVYISGYDSSSQLDGAMAKYDTNGTLQWQTGRNNALGDSTYLNAVAVDSSANAYFCGFAVRSSTAEYGIYFPKVNTSGTAQFGKFLSSNANAVVGTAIAVDGSDNVYVAGVTLGIVYEGIVAKYNSSGTLQWQRGLIAGTTDTTPYGVASDANGNVYLFGSLGSTAMFIAKLPGDGSLTGTYTVGSYSFTYSASSLTDGTISRDIPTALTGATPTLTASTTTLTEAAATLTSTVTTL